MRLIVKLLPLLVVVLVVVVLLAIVRARDEVSQSRVDELTDYDSVTWLRPTLRSAATSAHTVAVELTCRPVAVGSDAPSEPVVLEAMLRSGADQEVRRREVWAHDPDEHAASARLEWLCPDDTECAFPLVGQCELVSGSRTATVELVITARAVAESSSCRGQATGGPRLELEP